VWRFWIVNYLVFGFNMRVTCTVGGGDGHVSVNAQRIPIVCICYDQFRSLEQREKGYLEGENPLQRSQS